MLPTNYGNSVMNYTSQNDSVISLFCGAGGMSLGFTEAGLKPALAADVDSDAVQSYSSNIGGEARRVDLSIRDSDFAKKLSSFRGAFAIIGGPPCQGFSSAGLKSYDDPRNKLVLSYLNIIERVNPRWFLFENVEGILTSGRGDSVVRLVESFIQLGYNVRVEKVNFASFGLPQARKRVLIIGNRMGLHFDLPPRSHSFDAGKHRGLGLFEKSPTFDIATAGLGEAVTDFTCVSSYSDTSPLNPYDARMRAGNRSQGTTWHFAPQLSATLAEVAEHLRQGQTMKDIPEQYWHDSFRRRAFRRVRDGVPSGRRGGAPSGIKRLDGSLNALTITGGAIREFIHPHYNRAITPREAARLQSFPDRYDFYGKLGSVCQQIGNAFPPMAAEIFARHLITLDGRAGSGFGVQASHTDRATLLGFRLTDAAAMSPALACTAQKLGALAQQTLHFGAEQLG
ncbi:DNA cytosine methyltransferase [uncultured Agrobacterium sp.]|uniref:DNA cytosine methyltransferase n=1 Tax=uncultured Agrobacterium sp. TaxID=157277 RepID=UPI0025FD5556|nr:DNA cytosine methyltransferase [uncultured Agrobacterium sp.]